MLPKNFENEPFKKEGMSQKNEDYFNRDNKQKNLMSSLIVPSAANHVQSSKNLDEAKEIESTDEMVVKCFSKIDDKTKISFLNQIIKTEKSDNKNIKYLEEQKLELATEPDSFLKIFLPSPNCNENNEEENTVNINPIRVKSPAMLLSEQTEKEHVECLLSKTLDEKKKGERESTYDRAIDCSSENNEKPEKLNQNKKENTRNKNCIIVKSPSPSTVKTKHYILKPLKKISITENVQQKNMLIHNINLNHHCKNQDFMNKCIICYQSSNDIVSHYVHFHCNNQNDEVYCARLPELIIDKYTKTPVVGEILENKDLYKFECIFCDEIILGFYIEIYEHFSTHTGEYAFECNSCGKKSASKKDITYHCENFCKNDARPITLYRYQKVNQINASYCTDCNFIQLNKANVIKHLQNHHLIKRQPQLLCKIISLVNFFEDTSVPSTVENPKFTNDTEEILVKEFAEEQNSINIKLEIDDSIEIFDEKPYVLTNNAPVSNTSQVCSISKTKKPLTAAAEKQKKFRERRKLVKEKYEESKRKDRERYHSTKILVNDMTTREQKAIRRKWRESKQKQRTASKKLHPHTTQYIENIGLERN